MMSALTDLPAWLLVAVLAGALTAEAGLLIGVFLPGGTAALLLGTTTAPTGVAVAVAAGASVTGGLYGLHRGRRSTTRPAAEPAGSRRPTARLTARWAQLITRVGGPDGSTAPGVTRSAVIAGVSQGFGGTRTLAPRALGLQGVRPGVWLLGAGPAALVWAYLMVTAGDAGSQALANLGGTAGWAVPAALAAVAVLIMTTTRRAAHRTAPHRHPTGGGPRA